MVLPTLTSKWLIIESSLAINIEHYVWYIGTAKYQCLMEHSTEHGLHLFICYKSYMQVAYIPLYTVGDNLYIVCLISMFLNYVCNSF